MRIPTGRSLLAFFAASTVFSASIASVSVTLGDDKAVVRNTDKESQQLPAGEGWVSLFNGKNLDGWTQKNGWAVYRVRGNSIVGRTAEGSPNSFLCSDKTYGDFELRFEVKVDNALNSGVQIRSRSTPDYQDGRVHGSQVEIESSPGESGYIYGEATGRGWVSPTQPPHSHLKNDEWNQYHVRAVGQRIQTWINGQLVEDITDPSAFKEGFIGLQVHSIAADQGPFRVRWRNIEIKELNK